MFTSFARQRVSSCMLLYSLNIHHSWAGPGLRQQAGPQCRQLNGWQEPSHLSYYMPPSRVRISRWNTERCSNPDTVVWDAGIPSGMLTPMPRGQPALNALWHHHPQDALELLSCTPTRLFQTDVLSVTWLNMFLDVEFSKGRAFYLSTFYLNV